MGEIYLISNFDRYQKGVAHNRNRNLSFDRVTLALENKKVGNISTIQRQKFRRSSMEFLQNQI